MKESISEQETEKCCQNSMKIFNNHRTIFSLTKINKMRKEIDKWLNNYYDSLKNNQTKDFKNLAKKFNELYPLSLPEEFQKLNILIYSVDWETLLNPYIVQKLVIIMGFDIHPFHIFEEGFFKELIRDFIDNSVHKNDIDVNDDFIKLLMTELRESISKKPLKGQPKVKTFLNDFLRNLINNPTYGINYNKYFTSKLYNLDKNQSIINFRIHLINTDSDNSALIISSTPLPHSLAQMMYDYYINVYDLVNDEFRIDESKKPKNGIYLYFSEGTFINLNKEYGTILDDAFIEEQKQLRKQFYKY